MKIEKHCKEKINKELHYLLAAAFFTSLMICSHKALETNT
jgi:hypothetical protein